MDVLNKVHTSGVAFGNDTIILGTVVYVFCAFNILICFTKPIDDGIKFNLAIITSPVFCSGCKINSVDTCSIVLPNSPSFSAHSSYTSMISSLCTFVDLNNLSKACAVPFCLIAPW